ncbi:MAG TPA: hypothetical protein VK453_13560 [Micromonosporaceae bacterium]|nr:hypothetical protein [Micromonosporaceae bacterium]
MSDLLGCPGAIVDDIAGTVATSAWDAVCRSFADAAVSMLEFFANGFVGIPAVNLQSGGVRDVYAISLGLAGFVAVLLLLVQIARTAFTHDGSALAHGLIGLGKAALAFMLTLTVAGTALVAADEVTAFIVNRTFGNTEGLRDKLTALFTVGPNVAPSLLLILSLVCIALIVVLWFELLLRNAAVAVLIATSPIAAVGQIGEGTKAWWPKLVGATIQLIVLKPVIALVFALGLTLTGEGEDIASLLTGLVVLLLAALAWPAIARFFTFASVQMGGGMGLASLIGMASNQANAGGVPVGADPNQFSQAAEARTMGAHTGRAASATPAAAGGSSGAATGAGAAAAGGATAATGGAAAAVFGAKFALDAAQKGANSLVGKSEQMAGHAGLEGANPHANPAGYPRHMTPTWPQHSAEPPQSQHDEPDVSDDGPPPAPPPPGTTPAQSNAASAPGAALPVQHQRPPQAHVVEHQHGEREEPR